MIKVLQIVPALDGGGIENLLLNYYTNMNRNEIKFDFIVYGQKKGSLEYVFKDLGSTIYHISSRHESLFHSLKQMKRIISCNKYDIVHAHQNKMSFIPLFYAKKCGIQMRIAHSHTAYEPENLLNKVERKLFSVLTRHYATDWFTCGIDAGKWLYGKKAVINGKVHVMNNAIDVDKFTFNADVRKQKRKELGIEDKFVVGNVGRLSYQKNHEFLIQVFNEIYKINKDAILLLVGRGEIEDEVKKQVGNFGLTDVVKFLGIRDDVPNLLQAMDVFLLPSRYEGLPVVLVEAQAAGLKCIAADTITKEVKVTDLLEYIDLEKSAKYWSDEVLKLVNGYERKDIYNEIQLGRYDIKQEAKKMKLVYESYVKKHEC